ncbi:MAG TPA: SulP family inorganic anion transporter [Arachnia sp.]|nr:SulP family inorganic anion transporter [Arachnia sp.]HMT86903.1 SulP family inorganic anion transporter [Arachnia sp.]
MTAISWVARRLPSRKIAKRDAIAGLVLGVESVPDGLALGVLAGVNPLAGLYGYMFGTMGGALATATPLLAVQVTGATGVMVADAGLNRMADPERALYTLSVMVGLIMIAAGLLRLGNVLRFVPRAVMVGFISGIGVNTVLGQLSNFTGYAASGSHRLWRTLDLLLHFWQIHLPTFGVGVVTLLLIVVLMRSRLGALGLVVAIVVGSGLAALLAHFGHPIALVGDVATVGGGLPAPVLPDPRLVGELLIPALAIAFVGMVQGAGIATAFPDPSGQLPRPSRDFIGQGVGAVISGLFRGMPSSGSMSATALNVRAGARTRLSLFIAGAVMAVVVLVLGPAVGYVAFAALSALLIVVGVGTIRPAQMLLALRSGFRQAVVLCTTFVLTVLIPVQYAVIVGAVLGILLFVIQQADQFTLRQLIVKKKYLREVEPPSQVPGDGVLILQPHGNLFFASASAFAAQLPAVTADSRNAVVILRLRGIEDLGVSVAQIVVDYAQDLSRVDSRLIVNGGEELERRLRRNGVLDRLGEENYYLSGEWRGRVLAQANDDAQAWVDERRK